MENNYSLTASKSPSKTPKKNIRKAIKSYYCNFKYPSKEFLLCIVEKSEGEDECRSSLNENLFRIDISLKQINNTVSINSRIT